MRQEPSESPDLAQLYVGRSTGLVTLKDTSVPVPTPIVWRGRPRPRRAYPFNSLTLLRTSATNATSFNDSKLISTFAKAPSTAARANAPAVVKSDFMFGFETSRKDTAIRPTSADRSATDKGTAVACFSAASISVSPLSGFSRAALYAFITKL